MPFSRSDNIPFNYIAEHYSIEDPKVRLLVGAFSTIAAELMDIVGKGSLKLIRDFGLDRSVDTHQLSLCIFDLLLTVYFQETTAYCENGDLASALTDALLYEATGCLPGTPTKIELMTGQTCHLRGLPKNQMGSREWSAIPDTAGWLFAAEFAAFQGQFKNIGTTVAVHPFTIGVRKLALAFMKLTYSFPVPELE
ncbi:MAG: hypothetical protein ABI318_07455 [Chthoniobacteraceae bacterium]